MSNWISVKDRLPEEWEDVLVYLERPLKHGQRIAFSYYHEGHGWGSINGATWPGKPEPTHWQPLPAPPIKTRTQKNIIEKTIIGVVHNES